MKKKIIILVFVLCAVLVSVLYFNKDEKQIVVEEKKIEVVNEVKDEAKEEKIKEIKTVLLVTLEVLGEKYRGEVKDGDTVYLVMKRLQERDNFSFNYKEYPSLGIFVDEINGIRGEPGKYWIYYVNGVEASVSVSKYVLKEGDIISWKQE